MDLILRNARIAGRASPRMSLGASAAQVVLRGARWGVAMTYTTRAPSPDRVTSTPRDGVFLHPKE